MQFSSHNTVLVAVIAHNEEESIGSVLDELQFTLISDETLNFSLVVFDDCSSDHTRELSLMRGIRVISNVITTGNGMYMIPIYLKYALIHKFDFVVQIDADGQHPIDGLTALINHAISSNADISIGSRYCNSPILYLGNNSSFFDRILGTQLICLLLYISTSVSIRDPTSGFRVYNQKVINFFASSQDWPLDSFSFLRVCLKLGFSICEFPVTMKPRTSGRSEFSFFRKLGYVFTLIYSFIYSFFL